MYAQTHESASGTKEYSVWVSTVYRRQSVADLGFGNLLVPYAVKYSSSIWVIYDRVAGCDLRNVFNHTVDHVFFRSIFQQPNNRCRELNADPTQEDLQWLIDVTFVLSRFSLSASDQMYGTSIVSNHVGAF